MANLAASIASDTTETSDVDSFLSDSSIATEDSSSYTDDEFDEECTDDQSNNTSHLRDNSSNFSPLQLLSKASHREWNTSNQGSVTSCASAPTVVETVKLAVTSEPAEVVSERTQEHLTRKTPADVKPLPLSATEQELEHMSSSASAQKAEKSRRVHRLRSIFYKHKNRGVHNTSVTTNPVSAADTEATSNRQPSIVSLCAAVYITLANLSQCKTLSSSALFLPVC